MTQVFISNFTGQRVWKWDDNPADDERLVLFLHRFSWSSSGDYEVNRDGVGPVLRWQKYISDAGTWVPAGDWREVPLNVGDFILPRGSTGDMLYEPLVGPVPGYWESDQYGRPFDVNDLVAPPA